ncbi:MAG: WPE palindromic element domain-containing protein [Wolbachia sp.]
MRDAGIQQNLLQTEQHFQSKNWIPVSSTGMTSLCDVGIQKERTSVKLLG